MLRMMIRNTLTASFQDTVPVMAKIYSTLGRKFNKKDIEEAQKMGEELVGEDDDDDDVHVDDDDTVHI